MRQEYLRLRALGYRGRDAWRAAKVNTRFAQLEALGIVRVRSEPDEYLTADDIVGDGATERQRKEILDRAERDGVWIYWTEYLDPVDGWVIGDSCGGFIGDDWIDSEYDVDMKGAAIEALDSVDPLLCEGWV